MVIVAITYPSQPSANIHSTAARPQPIASATLPLSRRLAMDAFFTRLQAANHNTCCRRWLINGEMMPENHRAP